MVDSFRPIIKLQSEAEKEKFQQLSELHELVVKGKLTSPQGAIILLDLIIETISKHRDLSDLNYIGNYRIKESIQLGYRRKSIQLAKKSSCLDKKEFSRSHAQLYDRSFIRALGHRF